MPIGSSSRITRVLAERVSCGETSLLHRGGRERGPADDVAGGVDVLDRRAEVGLDGDLPARVGLQPGLLEVEIVGLALAARRVEHDVGGDALPARKVR